MGLGVSARRLIDYLGGLTLRGGDHDGQNFEVLGWEARFVRGAFAEVHDAALSVARGNGKSALVGGIAAAVVDPSGPLHGVERHVVVAAASFEQSRIVFGDVSKFLAARYDLRDRRVWRSLDNQNRLILEHRPSGAQVRCIGSDPATAHGLRPYICLLDEPAQHSASTRDRLVAAVRTGLGKTPGSRLIALGTRPADSGHWFARMLRGEAVGYAQTHAARPGDPPGHRRTWKRANPSLDHLPSLAAKIASEWQAAKANPSLLPSFEALRLNAGVSDTAEVHLIDAATWRSCEGDAERRGPVVWGVDLGGSAAMTAVAGYWPETGALDVLAAFPGAPSLAERGLRDGVGPLYATMAKRGELCQFGGQSIDVAAVLREALGRFGRPALVVADSWRDDVLEDSLTAARVPTVPLVYRRMGPHDGSQDLERLRRAVGEGRVIPRPSLLLRSAMSEARANTDAAGNQWLAKSAEAGRRLRARDDAAAASMLAVSEGTRRYDRRPARRRLRSALA